MIGALLRRAGEALCFAGGLGLGCAAIGLALPVPDVPPIKEKLEWFEAHRDEYTALFLGTSRVRRHIIPSLFDRLAAERGVPMRSFNFGVDSMAAPEDGFVLDQALRSSPRGLRYVFIELSFFRANFAGQDADTQRAAYWHDWERTRALWRQLVQEDFRQIRPLKKRKKNRGKWMEEMSEWSGLMLNHGRLFLQRSANLGRGAARCATLLGVRPARDSFNPLGPARDGFMPSPDAIRGPLREQYDRQISEIRTGPSRVRQLDLVPQENLETMLAKIRAHGAEPILFLAPSSGGYLLHPRREVAPLFDFSDPERWPELFDPQCRADVGHLNTAGAEIFTRRLSETFFAQRPAEHR